MCKGVLIFLCETILHAYYIPLHTITITYITYHYHYMHYIPLPLHVLHSITYCYMYYMYYILLHALLNITFGYMHYIHYVPLRAIPCDYTNQSRNSLLLRPFQKLPPSSIHNLLQDRCGSFDREGNFRGQVVGVRNCAYMARKGVTQQLICLLVIRDGQGSHDMCQSGLAIRKLHWQRISIGLVPAFKQTLRALCHELHVAINLQTLIEFPPSLLYFTVTAWH